MMQYGSLNDMTEEQMYWNPENSTIGIYEQLAQKRYREIPRQAIK